jgi:hypothetical protein
VAIHESRAAPRGTLVEWIARIDAPMFPAAESRIENGRIVAKQSGQIQLIHNDFRGGRDRD